MRVLAVDTVFTVGAAPGRNVDFTADYGLDARAFTGAVEVHRAVHHAVVRNGQGVKAQLFGALRQGVYAAGPVKQAVFGVKMQMYKAHISFPPAFRGPARRCV